MGIGLVVWTRRAFSEWRAILICSGLFLLGLVLYFYLPIASMTNPPINWGYPRTVEGFFHVLTRGQYEKMNPTADVGLFLEQGRLYFVMAGKEFGWLYLLLCLVPFCFLHRMAAPGRRWILGLLPAYVCLAFLMLAVLNPSADRQSLGTEQDIFFRVVCHSGPLDGLRTGDSGRLDGKTGKAAGNGSFSNLTAGDAELVHQFQFAPELGAGDFAPQQPAVF